MEGAETVVFISLTPTHGIHYEDLPKTNYRANHFIHIFLLRNIKQKKNTDNV